MLSIKNGWGWISSSIIPAVLWFLLRGVNSFRYAMDYRKYNRDINRLNNLCNNEKYTKNVNIDSNELNKERKYLFEYLINRGKINELIGVKFNFTQMLEAGVSSDMLLNVVQCNQIAKIRLQLAIAKYNVAQVAALRKKITQHNITTRNEFIALRNTIQQNTQGNDTMYNELKDELKDELRELQNTIQQNTQENNSVYNELTNELEELRNIIQQNNNLTLQDNV